MPLKSGDKVTVYEDPISQEKPEGKAELIARESIGMDGEEQWLVRFIGDFQCESKIARFSGVIDHNGVEVELGDTVRWMACCGDCFKGTVDFRQNTDEQIPFLSGFLVTKVKNITDEVMDEDGNILGGWNGELEVIKS